MRMVRHYMPTKVVFGRKTIYRLKDEVEQLSLNQERTAIICGKSAVSNGYVEIVKKQLSGKVEVFDSVEPDPTVENALKVLEDVKEFSPTLIVAIGGGSPLDVAKVVSVMLTNEGEIAEFIGITKQTVRNMLSADPELVLKKLAGELKSKEVKVHTAGGLAKLAYKEVKEGRDYVPFVISVCESLLAFLSKLSTVPSDISSLYIVFKVCTILLYDT